MNNRRFTQQTDDAKQRKLLAVLKARAGNTLDSESLNRLVHSIPLNRQYHVIVHESPGSPPQITLGEKTI